jgi:hypothetical protein
MQLIVIVMSWLKHSGSITPVNLYAADLSSYTAFEKNSRFSPDFFISAKLPVLYIQVLWAESETVG